MVLAHIANQAEVVKQVKVRLLGEHEEPEFDRLLIEKHYLHDARLAGQSLRYVAELDGQWLALLSFSAAALHLKVREKSIRWSPRLAPGVCSQQQPVSGAAGAGAFSQSGFARAQSGAPPLCSIKNGRRHMNAFSRCDCWVMVRS
jgi:hypothetical protein